MPCAAALDSDFKRGAAKMRSYALPTDRHISAAARHLGIIRRKWHPRPNRLEYQTRPDRLL